jgi:hypothetical protein
MYWGAPLLISFLLHTSALCGLRCDGNNSIPFPCHHHYTIITRTRRSSSSEVVRLPMLSDAFHARQTACWASGHAHSHH